MAYDEILAGRVRTSLSVIEELVEEKKMMGGLTFMVNNKMCLGVMKDDLLVRIDPDIYYKALTKKGARAMDFTGKPMKGFIIINNEGAHTAKQLEYWVQLALEYNKKAKSSKKKKN